MLARYSEPVDNTVESYDSSHLDVMFVVSSATTQEITKRREVKGKKKKCHCKCEVFIESVIFKESYYTSTCLPKIFQDKNKY